MKAVILTIQAFLWQGKLPLHEAYLWTLIAVTALVYGDAIVWYMGYNPWMYAVVPFAVQALFAWQYWLQHQVIAGEAAFVAFDEYALLPKLGPMPEPNEGYAPTAHIPEEKPNNVISVYFGKYLPEAK